MIVFSEIKSPFQGLRGLSGPGVVPCEKVPTADVSA